ncbi:MAG: hypothetical protein GDA68_08680 [Nitrospira sp. CR2.1]|nr:hypothetical protein [Nitrospira sp. CR2.1]
MFDSRLATVEELSVLIGVPSGELIYFATAIEKNYRRKVEHKPDGDTRIFFVPSPGLKKIQKCIHRRFLRKLPVHESIHSYRRRRDTISNASVHVGKQILAKLDIKKFFPSILPQRVYRVFLSRGCSPSVASLLTKLTTFENQLPQGPPTSPGIANQVLTPLAKRLKGVCDQHNLTLSIFADDIFVSGSEHVPQVNNLLKRIVESEGFTFNLRKTEMRWPGEKKIVTGISVTARINIEKGYYRKVRALVHHAANHGYMHLFPGVTPLSAKDKLQGMIRYISRLNASKGHQLQIKSLQIADATK